jgi:hypothetical protein
LQGPIPTKFHHKCSSFSSAIEANDEISKVRKNARNFGKLRKGKSYFRFNPSLGSSKNLPGLKMEDDGKDPEYSSIQVFSIGIQAVFPVSGGFFSLGSMQLYRIVEC